MWSWWPKRFSKRQEYFSHLARKKRNQQKWLHASKETWITAGNLSEGRAVINQCLKAICFLWLWNSGQQHWLYRCLKVGWVPEKGQCSPVQWRCKGLSSARLELWKGMFIWGNTGRSHPPAHLVDFLLFQVFVLWFYWCSRAVWEWNEIMHGEGFPQWLEHSNHSINESSCNQLLNSSQSWNFLI